MSAAIFIASRWQGIFVQIGLLPNTHWLEGALERNRMGEIIIGRQM
ncbi:reductase [Salmonella enterica subsp. enterica]|uniref:Reductase n=1 Tax=Salmonella enterica I TaxID=59201 RepID=A0A447PIX3_SALET|nr:reductase [Salmonella enterica subsp. enterica]